MKALLLSIKPQHAYNILNGNKTLELRTRVPKDFVGWVYVYVTKKKPDIMIRDYTINYPLSKFYNDFNGTIPFRFWFDEYEEYGNTDLYSFTYIHRIDKLRKNACITNDELYGYIKKVKPEEETTYRKYYPFYAWHIKKLEIFDKPMALGDFITTQIRDDAIIKHDMGGNEYFYYKDTPAWSFYFSRVSRPPQSYQFVWVKEEL